MVDTGELDSFLNADNCADGDIIEILGEGAIECKEDSKSGRKYKVLNLPIRHGVLELVYSPNADAQDILKKTWGRDTKAWVNKKFAIKIYPRTVFGVTKDAILPVILEQKA